MRRSYLHGKNSHFKPVKLLTITFTTTDWENNSDQTYETLASVDIIGARLSAFLKSLRSSQHYRIDWFQGGASIGPLLYRETLVARKSDAIFFKFGYNGACYSDTFYAKEYYKNK